MPTQKTSAGVVAGSFEAHGKGSITSQKVLAPAPVTWGMVGHTENSLMPCLVSHPNMSIRM